MAATASGAASSTGGTKAAVEGPMPSTVADSAEHPDGSEDGSLPELSRAALIAWWNSLRGDAYALDSVERFVDGSELGCSQENLVRYAGTGLRYVGSVNVNPAFAERLERFDALVREVGEEVYGRAPHRLRHFGAFSCRTSRGRAHRRSEHALGNAIDVTGFDFSWLDPKSELKETLPIQLQRPFRVTVAQHWSSPGGVIADRHERFLKELCPRLRQRDDVFRAMIGPARRDHRDHFHFDMSPWRYVHL